MNPLRFRHQPDSQFLKAAFFYLQKGDASRLSKRVYEMGAQPHRSRTPYGAHIPEVDRASRGRSAPQNARRAITAQLPKANWASLLAVIREKAITGSVARVKLI